MEKLVIIPGVCSLLFSGEGVEYFEFLSEAVKAAAKNIGETITVSQSKPFSDCNGPSWSHSSWIETKSLSCKITVLNERLFEDRKEKLFREFIRYTPDGWSTKMSWYAGRFHIE